jgi:hypothetical protein
LVDENVGPDWQCGSALRQGGEGGGEYRKKINKVDESMNPLKDFLVPSRIAVFQGVSFVTSSYVNVSYLTPRN